MWITNSGNLRRERIYLGGFEIWRRYDKVGGNWVLKDERETVHVSDDHRRICMIESLTWDDGDEIADQDVVPRRRFQLDNHLGTACVETDETGAVISYEEYHPYGTSSYRSWNGSAEVSAKRYRYTGKERDEETSLYYHGARYYAPWLGRWMSADPAGTVDGSNLFAYVRGSPVVFSDPSGTESIGDVFRRFAAEAHQRTAWENRALQSDYESGKLSGPSPDPVAPLPASRQPAKRVKTPSHSWAHVPSTPRRPPSQYVEAPSTPADAAVDVRAGREGGVKDFRIVPSEEAVDHQGRPFWEPGGEKAAHYTDPPVGTSDVEVALAVGGVLTAIGGVARQVARSLSLFDDLSINLGRDVASTAGKGPKATAPPRVTSPPASQRTAAALNIERTAERYHAVDPANPRLQATGYLREGQLELSIRTQLESGERGTIRGAEQFQAILEHFGTSNVSTIKGSWSYGSNLEAFNKAIASGLSPEAAAARTWTGQQAAAAGFDKVQIGKLYGERGAYTKAEVYFTR